MLHPTFYITAHYLTISLGSKRADLLGGKSFGHSRLVKGTSTWCVAALRLSHAVEVAALPVPSKHGRPAVRRCGPVAIAQTGLRCRNRPRHRLAGNPGVNGPCGAIRGPSV